MIGTTGIPMPGPSSETTLRAVTTGATGSAIALAPRGAAPSATRGAPACWTRDTNKVATRVATTESVATAESSNGRPCSAGRVKPSGGSDAGLGAGTCSAAGGTDRGSGKGRGVGKGRGSGLVTAESGSESKLSRVTMAGGGTLLITGGGGGAIDTERLELGRRATSIGQLTASAERSSGVVTSGRHS